MWIRGASSRSSVGGAGLGLWLWLWVNPMVHEVQSASPPENEEKNKRPALGETGIGRNKIITEHL